MDTSNLQNVLDRAIIRAVKPYFKVEAKQSVKRQETNITVETKLSSIDLINHPKEVTRIGAAYTLSDKEMELLRNKTERVEWVLEDAVSEIYRVLQKGTASYETLKNSFWLRLKFLFSGTYRGY